MSVRGGGAHVHRQLIVRITRSHDARADLGTERFYYIGRVRM